MDIIRFTKRGGFNAEGCTLDKFIDSVKEELKAASLPFEDESLIKIDFDSDYDSSHVTVIVYTPETAEEMVKRVKNEQEYQKRKAERVAAQEKAQLDRLAQKYGYSLKENLNK